GGVGGVGTPVTVVDSDAKRLKAMKGAFGKSGVFKFRKTLRTSTGGAVVLVSSVLKKKLPRGLPEKTLILRPPEFVVGLGCERGVSAKAIETACKKALKAAEVSPLSVRNFATIDIKRDERGLIAFAKREGKPVDFFSKAKLKRIKKLPSGPSRMVMEKVGVGGVCEPAALLSAGTEKLWVKKIKAGKVTAAVARAPFTS
ncbi:MAG: cobalamin biosynthesis protein, partial [Thermodesulfobacteriota bacterium]